jgi:Fic family protein
LLFIPDATQVFAEMEAFCARLTALMMRLQGDEEKLRKWGIPKPDRIMAAAQISHDFIRIHPYINGNGRVSRLIMCLVLSKEYPPVSIKADKKGRERYLYALRRANTRGDVGGLASLIALALISMFNRLNNHLDHLEAK